MNGPALPESVEAVAALIAQRTGLRFPESRREALSAAVARSSSRLRARTAEGLVAGLRDDPAALDELVAELTIPESYFFRAPEQFESVRRDVLPEIVQRRGSHHRVRILSAACASGEEPYSLAILLEEEGLLDRCAIVAGDISRPALDRAAKADYGGWSLRGTTESFRSRYFRVDGSRFRLVPRLQERVEWVQLNLAADFHARAGLAGFDLVFCRNALIYFDANAIPAVARRLFAALAEGGWLFTGASDPPLGAYAPFETVPTAGGLAYRRLERKGSELAPAPEPQPVHAAAPSPVADALAPTPPAPKAAAPVAEPATSVAPAPEPAASAGGLERIRALAAEGSLAEALRAAAEEAARQPGSAELQLLHAILLAESGLDREAAALFRRALYMDRQLAVAALSLGFCLARLGDRRGAQSAFRRARALLAGLPPDAQVPLTDGERAGRLLATAHQQLEALARETHDRIDDTQLE